MGSLLIRRRRILTTALIRQPALLAFSAASVGGRLSPDPGGLGEQFGCRKRIASFVLPMGSRLQPGRLP